MSKDEFFRDNVAFLIRSEMLRKDQDSNKKEAQTSPKVYNPHHAHVKNLHDGRGNTGDSRAPSYPKGNKKNNPNADFTKPRFMRDCFKEWHRKGEKLKDFKLRFLDAAAQGYDPRLFYRNDIKRKNLSFRPSRGGKFRHSDAPRGCGDYSNHGNVNPYQRHDQNLPGPSHGFPKEMIRRSSNSDSSEDHQARTKKTSKKKRKSTSKKD